MRIIELERIIRLALQHKCGAARLKPGEAPSLATALVGVASLDTIAEVIAQHASHRLGPNVVDLREEQWRHEIREMLVDFVALHDALDDTRSAARQ